MGITPRWILPTAESDIEKSTEDENGKIRHIHVNEKFKRDAKGKKNNKQADSQVKTIEQRRTKKIWNDS